MRGDLYGRVSGALAARVWLAEREEVSLRFRSVLGSRRASAGAGTHPLAARGAEEEFAGSARELRARARAVRGTAVGAPEELRLVLHQRPAVVTPGAARVYAGSARPFRHQGLP